MKKRITSLLLALVLCLGLMPASIFAEEGDEETEDTAPETITVNFDSRGGSSVAPRTYTIGEPYGDLPTPTREGYIFDGWSWKESSSQRVKEDETVSDFSTTLYAQWAAEAPPEFEIEDGVLKKYNGSNGSVVIPDGVTSIGQSAFSGCSTLSSVVIPDGVTNIGAYAFHQCRNLRSVDIPSSVTTIETGAFSICENLKQITIPDGVRRIGVGAFSGSGLTSVTLPDSVTEVGSQTFYMCSSLEKATLGSGLNQLSENMFYGCSSLKTLTLPATITSLYYSLTGCKNLTDIYCGGSQRLSDPYHFVTSYNITVHYSDGTTDSRNEPSQPVRVTVSFDSDGGSSVPSKTVTVGEEYGELPTPTREGYIFRDWGLIRTGQWITSSSLVNLKVDHTLTAFWDKAQTKTAKVSFDSAGGSSVSGKTVTVGEKYGDLPTPTREGYTFDGWYPSSTGGSEVTSSTTVTQTSDHTLYARWIEANGQPADGLPDWAAEQVNGAIALGLVPQELQEGYDLVTTRAQFCALAVKLYENVKGEIAGRETFTDTDDENAQKMASLGVVSGVGGGRFDPDGPLTREQAASILARLASVMGQPFPDGPHPFTDGVSSWADATVGQAYQAGIMAGTGDTTFTPQGEYTRVQSIATIMRLYDHLTK